jgi:flagellar hook-length control protein FliK
VHSVTSEAATSLSFQGATPQRPARSDQSSGKDSFGALVDSSKPADTSNDRATSAAQQQSASQRRSDDTSATAADNARSRDAAAADQAARSTSDNRDATARQLSDANANTNADANANANAGADAVQPSAAKSSALKAGALKSTEKSSSDKTSAADSLAVAAASAQQGGLSATTPNAVAVVIPVAIASTDIPTATPAAGNATAPLAIAAAAIAASSSAAAAPAASSAQIKIDSEAANAATAPAAATATTSDAAATAKIAVQAAATAAVATPVKQQATQTDATAVTDVTLATAVAATAPVAPKTTMLKAPVAAPTKTAASGASDMAPGTSDPSATATPAEAVHINVAQQPAVAGKQEAGNGIVDAAKADASASSSSISAAVVSAHEHSPVTGTAHTLTDSANTGVQATGAIQPQLPSAAATAPPVGPLSVMPATNAAVPLSGLALEIAVSARSGKSRFEIRLDPADLGRIDVRIDVDRNGQVTSHLTVEKPETLSMLRQDAPQLQRALDDAGLKTGNGGLQFSLRDQSSSGQNNGNETGRNAQRLVISDEDTIPAAVAGRTYGRMLGSSSGVDIRV